MSAYCFPCFADSQIVIRANPSGVRPIAIAWLYLDQAWFDIVGCRLLVILPAMP
ncbi:hypothetical protein P3T16_004841 [Paraburkholderia sp. GAS42]